MIDLYEELCVCSNAYNWCLELRYVAVKIQLRKPKKFLVLYQEKV